MMLSMFMSLLDCLPWKLYWKNEYWKFSQSENFNLFSEYPEYICILLLLYYTIVKPEYIFACREAKDKDIVNDH